MTSRTRNLSILGVVLLLLAAAGFVIATKSTRLGLDEFQPLVGIFGFLKPYKRIAESLRALRRLTRIWCCRRPTAR